jgi:hypothetical protein
MDGLEPVSVIDEPLGSYPRPPAGALPPPVTVTFAMTSKYRIKGKVTFDEAPGLSGKPRAGLFGVPTGQNLGEIVECGTDKDGNYLSATGKYAHFESKVAIICSAFGFVMQEKTVTSYSAELDGTHTYSADFHMVYDPTQFG